MIRGRDDFALRLGDNMRDSRQKAGLSQQDVAVRASMHRTAVSLLERGERIARTDTLVRIADSIGVSPVELLDGLRWSQDGYEA